MLERGPRFDEPLIVINYKVYPQALGKGAVDLTKRLEAAASSFPDATVAVCPSHPDLAPVAQATELPVLAQGVDGSQPGSGTGKVLPESLNDLGVQGSLINHAENQVPFEAASQAVQRLTELEMVSIVCAADEQATQDLAGLQPSYVAMEPPALIGGETSVTTADPGIIEASVAAARKVDAEARVLCGAGVKTGEDVAAALQLGTRGVLVASGVVKADDPGAALAGLLEGATKGT